ncbi:SDR family NAD(P)-dependent oxidoreductase [Nocardia sp. NPDC058518]|uniref:SDR family NAD(P)-dependent oxidoreductase n=1 Tax=Nocardia sp. NPDC058518 TaxID=3346534 RepID=UPI003669F0BA
MGNRMTSHDSWLGLSGKTAVVTGAGGGIGRGTALELARVGVQVAVVDLNGDGAFATAEMINSETGVKAVAYVCDTSDPGQVSALAGDVRADLGQVEVLVNNAGIVGAGDLMETSLDNWQRTFDVNVTGYLNCCRAFVDGMLERGAGSVVHIASICGTNAAPHLGAYSPSKAAVIMLSRQLAVEWAQRGVRSNTIGPGFIRTPLTEGSYTDAKSKDAREQSVPMHRIGLPQDIADAVLWLASDRSGYVTGQHILVDGGLDHALLGIVRSSGPE